MSTTGTLSIVATPIGNLEDITLRALRVLKEADAIYAEDTRVIAKLLSHYGIHTSVHRLDAATETRKADEIIERLERGEKVAFVSDAGTPGISDPGSRLVAACRAWPRQSATDVRIEAIPGPSALTAAISISGIDMREFTFLGFLPHKKGRQTALKEIATSRHPVMLYESPHRILKLMEEINVHVPEARVTIARELTKKFEEVVIGTAPEMAAYLEGEGKDRGEFAVIIEPR